MSNMRIRLSLLAVSVLLPAAFAAEKKQALPKDLPAYGPLKPAAAPHVSQLKLDNGLVIWMAPMPGFPKVGFTLTLRGGYTMDPKDRPGQADLLASTVTQGTKSRSAKQIAEEMQSAGGDLGADARADSIQLQTSVLASRAGAGLKVLADVAQNAVFADDEVEIARRNAASGLDASEAEPGFLARRALYRALFGDHPYSVTSATRDSIAKTTAAELRQQFQKRFRPDAALLVAVGDFDPAQMESAARAAFGAWPSGTAQPESLEKPKPTVTKAVVYVPRANSVQTALYMGSLGPDRADADYPAARVANAIYGGMFGSRLVLNIREDKGYTYSPSSGLSSLRQTGVILTRADVRNPVTGASFNEMTYELNRMATTALEPEELERAKRFLVGSQAIQLQSRDSIARSLAELWVAGLPPEELGRQSEKIEQVTSKDAEAAGRKYFPAWRMTVVAVGDEKVIKDELAPFGLEFQKAQ